MLIVGVALVLTDIVIALELTVALLTQAALDVKSQVTISLLFKAALTNVDATVPVAIPFTFQL